MNSFARCVMAAALAVAGASLTAAETASSDTTTAAKAINALGLDLLAKGTPPGESVLLSPYSIQAALAMTFAGADGETRAEMARVLHYSPNEESQLHNSFAALQRALEDIAKASKERAELAQRNGQASDPFTLTVANRLFGQQGYEFRPAFLNLTKETYAAPFQLVDFIHSYRRVRTEINHWVEEQTRDRIQDLIPPDGLNQETRLVLVNAIYMKAPWADPFPEKATRPEPFYIGGGAPQEVPTMIRQGRFGYAERDGFRIVTIPYGGGGIQFLILLPDQKDGLAALEQRLMPEMLANTGQAPYKELILHLPKFKMQPPLFRLGKTLRELGMNSAFDVPKGSANFDRMAPRKPDDYLCISEVFHKTFLDLDEKGTEAAAATAVVMMRVTSAVGEKPKPIEVKVDRPFLFAIQHRPSGACLFLGRLQDPRGT